MLSSKLKLFSLAAVSFLIASTVSIHLPSPSSSGQIEVNSAAQARRSGGRAGGGSFGSSGSRRSSSPSRPSRSQDYNSNPYGSRSTTVIVGGSGDSDWDDDDDGGWLLGLAILILLGGSIVWFVSLSLKAAKTTGGSDEASRTLSVIENDIVTVSKVQVALLSEARQVQTDLNAIAAGVDTSTPAGLLQLLQESALAVLRTPENWAYALSSSETVNTREAGAALFNQMSIAERSKFSAETLVNVGGKVRKTTYQATDADPAAYIVMTLLVGTAHDRPLFDKVDSAASLRNALEKLAAMPSDYLLTVELLWTPQQETDSLSADDLLAEYSDLAKL